MEEGMEVEWHIQLFWAAAAVVVMIIMGAGEDTMGAVKFYIFTVGILYQAAEVVMEVCV